MEAASSFYWLIVVAQVLFVLSALGLLIYAFFVAVRTAFYKPPPDNEHLPAVSVIIAARNEASNLTKHLPGIFAQDYPEFEVVVVNDSSYDDTEHILNEMAADHANLRIVTIAENDKHDGGKKLAITLGIKAAKYDRLLFTDADCRPVTGRWIRTIMARRNPDDALVLGFAPYEKQRGLLNAVIRIDALTTAMDYFGYALAGMPYMGVGRNLSYCKKTFFDIGGFRTHYALASGDDDLLVNQTATRENTAICMDPDSHVVSLPKQTWGAYWHQKRRHITTGHRYKRMHRYLLIARPVAVAILIVTAATLLAVQSWTSIVLSVLVALFLLRMVLFYRSMRWLDHRDILIFAPVLEVGVLVGTAAAHIANAFKKPNQWKK